MDEEDLMSIDPQPLALWSPSLLDLDDVPDHHQQQQMCQQPPGCNTPLASPVHKSAHSAAPFTPNYLPKFGQPSMMDQQDCCWPPSASSHPHHQQQPVYSDIPPPPPYFGGGSAAEQFPQHQQTAMSFRPHSSLAAMEDHGHGPSSSQQQMEQRRTAKSQHKVQQWQQFGTAQQMPLPPHDSGVHSMSASTATSVMSMSSIHPASFMSGLSSLPDEFPPGLQEHPYFRNMPASIRHEDPDKMRQVLPELIPLINDESDEIALRALTILGSIAQKDKELTLHRPLIEDRRVVEELLRTLWTHKKNKKVICRALKALHFISDNVPSGRELFVQTLTACGVVPLQELLHCIGIQEQSCFKYAFIVLHNLMSDPRIGRKVIGYMCEMRVLAHVTDWLGDKNEKFLNIVTDIVQLLVNRNGEQMAFFLALNGHQRLIHILANSQQETLLYRVAKLLNRVAPMDAAKLVAAGLLEAAQNHLAHPSQRLLRQLLDCVRAVSHVPSAGHEIQPLLQKLLQLLGTNDLRLKEICTDILANLSANNAQNKEFLVQCGAVFALFQLLHELTALQEALGPSQQREGIEDSALTLLRALCTGNSRANTAKRQMLSSDVHKRLLLDRLRQPRPSMALLRRTLMLVQQLAQDRSELAALRFAVTFPPPFPQLPDAPLLQHSQTCSFASQTVLLLLHSMNFLPDSADTCQRTLDILRAMARDGQLLEEIFAELRVRRVRLREGHGRLLVPQVLLCFYDHLAPGAVALLAELVRLPEAVQLLRRDQSTLDSLQRWANTEKPPTAQLAAQTLQLLKQPLGAMASQHPLGRADMTPYSSATYPPPPAAGYPPAHFEGTAAGQSPVLNNSPAHHMDFSPAANSSASKSANIGPGDTTSQQQSQQMRNGEQLAFSCNNSHFPAFQQQIAPEGFPVFPGDEFGPFVSALCADSSPADWGSQHCPQTE